MILFCIITGVLTIFLIIFSIKTMVDTRKIRKARDILEQADEAYNEVINEFKKIKTSGYMLTDIENNLIAETIPEDIHKPDKIIISYNPVSIKKMRRLKNLVDRYKMIPGVSWT